MPLLIGASLGVHAIVLVSLALLGAAPERAPTLDTLVEFEVARDATPAPVIAPPPSELPPEPLAVAAMPPPITPRPRAVEPRPTPAAEAPAAEAPAPEPTAEAPRPQLTTSAAPPSLDDVFGSDSAPSAEVMASTGTGGFGMDLGTRGGTIGGRPGGRGTGIGTGEGVRVEQAAPAGPSEADRRRARRAYVRSLEGLLGGRVHYPRAAMRDRAEGRTELCLRIGADGRVLGQRVCRSAGHELLDSAALDAAAQLDRVPAPPAMAAWAPDDEIHAGVVFVLR